MYLNKFQEYMKKLEILIDKFEPKYEKTKASDQIVNKENIARRIEQKNMKAQI